MGGGLLLAPLTTQPWHLYLTIGVLVGAGSVCLGYSGQSLFLPNWFVRRRGLADGARLCRRRHRLGDLAAMGAAHDRADRLAHRLHRDGHSGASPCSRRSISCCASAPRISACCRMAMRRRRRHRPHLARTSSIPCGPTTDWTLRRALRTARFWWISLWLLLLACTSGTRCRCTRPNSCSTSAFSAERRGVGARRGQPARHSRPDLARASLRPDRARNGSGPSAVSALRSASRRADRSEIRAGVAAGLSHDLHPGRTRLRPDVSVMGAVVLEIFQGRQYGSIFGTIMLAALAGGAARPMGDRAAVLIYRAATSSAFAIGIAVSILSAVAIWRASPGKVRAVAGQNAQGANQERRGLAAVTLDHGLIEARASMSKVLRSTSAPSLITRYVAA